MFFNLPLSCSFTILLLQYMIWCIPSLSHSCLGVFPNITHSCLVVSPLWHTFFIILPTLANIKVPILAHSEIYNSQGTESTLVLIVRFLFHENCIQIANHQLKLLILNPIRLSWNLLSLKVISSFSWQLNAPLLNTARNPKLDLTAVLHRFCSKLAYLLRKIIFLGLL